MIIRAAMKVNGTVQSLPKPKRHHDIIRKFPRTQGHKHGEQGFIDSELGFVSREVAKVIAVASDQLLERAQKYSDELFSEDVW